MNTRHTGPCRHALGAERHRGAQSESAMGARASWLRGVLFVLACVGSLAPAWGFETVARQAYLLDVEHQQILLDKNSAQRMFPASMTKIMTVYMLFDRLKSGELSMDNVFPVSRRARAMGGSRMFVDLGTRVSIEDLLRGIIVQSGNDASVVVAEGLAGSEDSFARLMTLKAQKLGMTQTQFTNASGWPDEAHYTTARDLAVVTLAMIERFPEYYPMFKEKVFTYNDIRQENRNPVLWLEGLGADGLKTGYTEASGYGLVASAEQGERRLILVLNGLESQQVRRREAERLLNWGFREWQGRTLFEAGRELAQAQVWLGQREMVGLGLEEDVALMLRRTQWVQLQAQVHFKEPVAAPIRQGDVLGHLEITSEGMEPRRIPLYAMEDVQTLGFVSRLRAALHHALWGS